MTTVEDVQAAEQAEYAKRDEYAKAKVDLDNQLQAALTKYQNYEIDGSAFSEIRNTIQSQKNEFRKQIFALWQASIDTKNRLAAEIGQTPVSRVRALQGQIDDMEKLLMKTKAELAVEQSRLEG